MNFKLLMYWVVLTFVCVVNFFCPLTIFLQDFVKSYWGLLRKEKEKIEPLNEVVI